MKYVFACILSFLSALANAQAPHDLRQGNADYPVPVPVALLAIPNGMPRFLEPSTVRTLTFAGQSIWSSDGAPRYAGAFEFAPVMMGANLDQSDYLSGRLDRVAYRVRLSLAAQSSARSGLNTALGLRLMLHDDADPRADSSWQRALFTWARSIPALWIECKDDTLSKDGRRCLTEAISRSPAMQPRIDSLRHAFMETHWNKSVFELAFAAVYHSDPSINALVVQRYCGFFSAGYQFQAGISGWVGHGDLLLYYQRQGNFTLRWQLGDAWERAFVGVALAARTDAPPDHRLECGVLTRLANGLWLRSFVGTSLHQHPIHGPEAGLTLAFGTPEIQ